MQKVYYVFFIESSWLNDTMFSLRLSFFKLWLTFWLLFWPFNLHCSLVRVLSRRLTEFYSLELNHAEKHDVLGEFETITIVLFRVVWNHLCARSVLSYKKKEKVRYGHPQALQSPIRGDLRRKPAGHFSKSIVLTQVWTWNIWPFPIKSHCFTSSTVQAWELSGSDPQESTFQRNYASITRWEMFKLGPIIRMNVTCMSSPES